MRRILAVAALTLVAASGCTGPDHGEQGGRPSPTATTHVTVVLDGGRAWPVTRPVGCDSLAGSLTDLDSEPGLLQVRDILERYVTVDGCPVRLDVILHQPGPEHCGWQSAHFIRVGRPLGAPVPEDGPVSRSTSRQYLWDPTGVVPNSSVLGRVISRSELPPGVESVGWRRDGRELYQDPTDVSVLYLVGEDDARVFEADFDAGGCG